MLAIWCWPGCFSGLALWCRYGAAITVGLEAVGVCVWAAEGREAAPDIDGVGMWVLVFRGSCRIRRDARGMSGGMLGPLQGG